MIAAAGVVIDGGAFLRDAGLDPDDALDPKVMIPDRAYYDMLEGIAAEIDQGAAQAEFRTQSGNHDDEAEQSSKPDLAYKAGFRTSAVMVSVLRELRRADVSAFSPP